MYYHFLLRSHTCPALLDTGGGQSLVKNPFEQLVKLPIGPYSVRSIKVDNSCTLPCTIRSCFSPSQWVLYPAPCEHLWKKFRDTISSLVLTGYDRTSPIWIDTPPHWSSVKRGYTTSSIPMHMICWWNTTSFLGLPRHKKICPRSTSTAVFFRIHFHKKPHWPRSLHVELPHCQE